MEKILLVIAVFVCVDCHAFGSRNDNEPEARSGLKMLSGDQPMVRTKPTTPKASTGKSSTTQGQTNGKLTRKEVLLYGDSGSGSPYLFGGSQWSVEDRKLYGADCSGFVQKSWQYPYYTATDEKIVKGRVDSKEFVKASSAGYPWSKIAFNSVLPADAYAYNDGEKGHVLLVSEKEDGGIVSLEARSKKYRIGYANKTNAYLKNKGFQAFRRNGIM